MSRNGGDGGSHICYVADQDTASAGFLEAFARRGVAKGQRVLWVLDEARQGTLARLVERHVRGGDGSTLGGLEHCTAEDLYLISGRFDIDEMLARYEAAVAESLATGFTGLRVLADTSWLAQRPEAFEGFVLYEQQVTGLTADGTFAAICHYDPRQVPVAWVNQVTDVHPVHANGHGGGLEAGMCRIVEREPGHAALTGAIDFSNARAVGGMLTELAAAASGDLRIDAGDLRFVDVAGSRALVQAARAPDSTRLVVHDPPPSLRLVLEVTGWDELPDIALIGPGVQPA